MKKLLYSLLCSAHPVITGAAETQWHKGEVLPEKSSLRMAAITEQVTTNMSVCLLRRNSHELIRAVRTYGTVVKMPCLSRQP